MIIILSFARVCWHCTADQDSSGVHHAADSVLIQQVAYCSCWSQSYQGVGLLALRSSCVHLVQCNSCIMGHVCCMLAGGVGCYQVVECIVTVT
jgi:hypothetical protein